MPRARASLDAEPGAVRRTDTHRALPRERGSDLSVLDDGKDALTAIATNIGHSRKRQMSFDERMCQAMLGQYGIGLLGFWAVGYELRISSRVANSEVWALTLFENSSRYAISRMPDAIDRPPTWTELQVRWLHRAAFVPLSAADWRPASRSNSAGSWCATAPSYA